MMSKTVRVSIFSLILGLILFLGLVFSAWTIPHVVQPVADTIWLFLRVFILSVDQVYYWDLLLITVILWGIYRFARRKSLVQQRDVTLKNETIENVMNWQESLKYSIHNGIERDIARDKLLRLIIVHYETCQPGVEMSKNQQDLERHLLPLPDTVYAFLFHSKSNSPNSFSLSALRQSFHRWYRYINGDEQAAFDHMIDDLIDFLNV